MARKDKARKKPLERREWAALAVRAAIARHQRGEVDEAAATYREVLASVPDQPDALHFLGVAEHQRGRSERAIELMAQAARLTPGNPELLSNRGNILKRMGRLDEAEQDYRAALAAAPGHPNAMSNLATVLHDRGRFEESLALLREVVAAAPDHADAYINMGAALGGLERYDEALEAHRHGLRLKPSDPSAFRALASTFYALGRVADAFDVYTQWAVARPDDPEPRHMLAATGGGDTPERASDDYVRSMFDRFSASFDGTLERLGYRAPALVGEAFAAALGPPAASLDVLDAGCGTGLCAPHLRPWAKALVGVDLSQGMVDKARVRGGYDELVVAELTAFLREHPARYDAIVSADTLVYFGDLVDVARAAALALRPGAPLVFTVERAEEAETPAGFRLQPHGRYCHTERYLRATLAEAGLDVREVREAELRREVGRWVRGWLVTARSPSSS